ncbi:TonB-dependent receptor [Pseudomonas sp. C27(2019)]|uniref:TonB-dependent receptor n=1 Tax=Pseudomonas sp. C27(2019) TaxID=2604941 RepID=UPI0012457384|nr:TonB-dependent receptor [Pseudomonas sp. C27(2019)]QEY59575.1 TonB-dependent receptor [Pseudomonas sp. C27(2019)]
MKLSRLALAVALLPASTLYAAADNNEDALKLSSTVITANRIAQEDVRATYASEVHNADDIKNSAAINLYDYLGRFSSVNVMPNYGNPYQQALDMRGYGIGDGYQNIVVTINGRRLNNIDMQPQLLSSIPLSSIERIEIIKGSGSVAQGDGAMAGIINIVTKDQTGVDISIAAGSDGYSTASISAGLSEEFFALQFLADNSKSDGLRKKDASGKADESDADNLSATLKLFPVDGLELRVGKDRTRIDTIYGASLSKKEFNKKPSQLGENLYAPGTPNTYTEQELKTDTNRLGASYQVNELLSLNMDHAVEKKESEYSGSAPSKYDYRSTDFSSQLVIDNLTLTAGAQLFDGERKQNEIPFYKNENTTTKDNQGFYLQGLYTLGDTTFSAGARHEKVKYKYKEATKKLKEEHSLDAWDIGINHQYSQELSVFANLNQAFQAPDIDRFFNVLSDKSSVFNSFIKPAKSKTLNIGLNHVTERNKLKVTGFYSKLKNEIYYYSTGNWMVPSYNTNIDKSYKYGIEIQDSFQATSELLARVNYAWTRAKIDKEDVGNGAYNGKKLPGVSEHSITAGVDYRVVQNGTLSLTQNWRSRAYAANDFANNFNQKQKAYNTTDFGYSHKIDKFTLFAQVNNVFDKKNGLWISDDNIYPVNFTRTWYAGVRASF